MARLSAIQGKQGRRIYYIIVLTMNVGIARITLRVPYSRGLKDKRRVVNSLRRRALNKFDVAIAEVDINDSWQTASLGVACVSDGAAQTRRVLDNVIRFIESERPDAEVIDCETEIIRFG